jgi:hypothetical protein
MGWIVKQPTTEDDTDLVSFSVHIAGTCHVRNTGTRPITNGDRIYFDTTPAMYCSAEGKEAVARIQDPSLPGYEQRFPFPIYPLDNALDAHGQVALMIEINHEAMRFIATSAIPDPGEPARRVTYAKMLCESAYGAGIAWLDGCGCPPSHPLRALAIWFALQVSLGLEVLNVVDVLFDEKIAPDLVGYRNLLVWCVDEQAKFETTCAFYKLLNGKVPDSMLTSLRSLDNSFRDLVSLEDRSVGNIIARLLVHVPQYVNMQIIYALAACADWRMRYVIAISLGGAGPGGSLDMLLTKV